MKKTESGTDLARVNAELAAATRSGGFEMKRARIIWGAFALSRAKTQATGMPTPYCPQAGQNAT